MIPGDSKSILIIDDDLTIRKLIGFHLKKSNYSVYEASGSEEGFKILAEQSIELVLCDVGMEGMDGYTFCRKVRENENYRVLPFIFVTAKTSIEDKEKALAVGGDDYITKPFNVQELLIKVQALLRRTEIYRTYGAKKKIEAAAEDDTIKILLVDDDVSLSKLFQYNLSKAGFDCKVANNATDGLSIARSYLPDIIISDIMMPDIDGYQFRKWLLDDTELRAVPFIFLTAKGGEEDILEGYDLGITDYVLKTAGPRVVVAKVSAIIKSLGKERQKVVSELHKAADSLRVKVVPESFPSFAGYDIKHWHIPFKGIPGGDFIDYFQLKDNTIGIVLGDVMGKRWGAWYFAVAYAGYVRSAVRVAVENAKICSPKSILETVNHSIYQDSKISEVFATLSIVIIDSSKSTIKYSGAGDLPIFYRKASDGNCEMIKSTGMLLGFSANGMFEDYELKLDDGDILLMITDGIIESRNSAGLPLGTDNLISLLKEIPGNVEPLDYIKEKVNQFTGNKYEDDMSVIAIKKKNGEPA